MVHQLFKKWASFFISNKNSLCAEWEGLHVCAYMFVSALNAVFVINETWDSSVTAKMCYNDKINDPYLMSFSF